MTANGIAQIVVYFAALVLLVKPLGWYMAQIYEGKPAFLNRWGASMERVIYRLCEVRQDQEMNWKTYGIAVLLFSLVCVLLLYSLQRVQGLLPLNPQGFPAVSADSSFNTASSFVTNTNWQGYGGESTMSYLTQMAGLAVQNFASAAAGMAVVIALIRGIARRNAQTIGNFWVDLTRGTLYILLPLSFILALVFVSQGVVQTFDNYHTVPLVQAVDYDAPKLDRDGQPIKDDKGNPVTEKATQKEQLIALGPVASQLAIKHLGTNGGGFFNANSAHPFESPTPLTDFLMVLSQTLIAAALTYTFGRMVGDTRQGWAVLAAMLSILAVFVFAAYAAESAGNPRIAALGVDQTSSASQPGGNMEGKEVRFGIARSALFATTTTATSCGAVDAMHDSFTPLGGAVPLFMMHLGEVVLGGVGSGLYCMLIYAIIAVFVAGLMVGRTPEYLGKKIETYEMKMAAVIILIMPIVVLLATSIAVLVDPGKAGVANPGAHGFSEILYAFTSMGNNNGSAFAGLSANTPFYNTIGDLVMLFGRFWIIVPTLALAGSLAAKKYVPAGPGSLPTHTPLFITLLVSIVLIVGGLTFIPALALGPVVEHLIMIGVQ